MLSPDIIVVLCFDSIVSILMFNLKISSSRDQTVLWIGVQFCACMFLDSRNKSLKCQVFDGMIKETKEQKKNKRTTLLRNPLKCTRYTVWSRNVII